MKVHWTDRAKARLRAIREHIAKDSEKAANTEIEKILRRSRALAKLADKDIHTSDIEELSDDFFAEAVLQVPAKQSVTLRIDSDVLTWFKGQGKGYQTRINQLLRSYMQSQQR